MSLAFMANYEHLDGPNMAVPGGYQVSGVGGRGGGG
jgi:hypothetical protein